MSIAPAFILLLQFAAKASATAPDNPQFGLCFEITETAVIDNPRLALDVMNELKQTGIGISIDDYGSGLSSLSYLRAIPAEELKIDKVFVENLGNGNSNTFLVKSTIDLAHPRHETHGRGCRNCGCPRDPAHNGCGHDPTPPELPASLRSLHVLTVDDHPG